MYAVRLWSVSHARFLAATYRVFERGLRVTAPLLSRIGYDRLERPVAAVERSVKGLLFDCRMCGQCVLGDTGLSCPMNCPKSLRNGPCGGVRPDGHCEVQPEMRCVWVEAWRGAGLLGRSGEFVTVQSAVDHRLAGRSSWLRAARRFGEETASSNREVDS